MKTVNYLLQIMGLFLLFFGLFMLFCAFFNRTNRDKTFEWAFAALLFIQFALVDLKLALMP